jgi:hypothetical protein
MREYKDWPSSAEDFEGSLALINNFFDAQIIPHMSKWDICIKIERKGALIFDEQQTRRNMLACLTDFKDGRLDGIKELLENKSLLIFDDSINDGYNIRRVLNLVLEAKPTSVTVSTLICREDTLIDLQNDYSTVQFEYALVESEDNFSCTYGKKIYPYLEYICKPIQNDHPILIIYFSECPDENIIFNFFQQYGTLESEKWPYLDNYNDRFKYHVVLNKSYINQLKICDELSETGCLSMDELCAKIRIYLRKDGNGILILQSMILEGFTDCEDRTQNDVQLKLIDFEAKKCVLIEFLIKDFLLEYLMKTDIKISNFKVNFKPK